VPKVVRKMGVISIAIVSKQMREICHKREVMPQDSLKLKKNDSIKIGRSK